MRRGEIMIGGPTVSAGYFINPAEPDEEVPPEVEIVRRVLLARNSPILLSPMRANGTLPAVRPACPAGLDVAPRAL